MGVGETKDAADILARGGEGAPREMALLGIEGLAIIHTAGSFDQSVAKAGNDFSAELGCGFVEVDRSRFGVDARLDRRDDER